MISARRVSSRGRSSSSKRRAEKGTVMHSITGMRTTLSLDDDVLLAVKDRARRERRSVGAVLSELARQALTARQPEPPGEEFHGVRSLPPRGGPVSNAMIDLLREDEPE